MEFGVTLSQLWDEFGPAFRMRVSAEDGGA